MGQPRLLVRDFRYRHQVVFTQRVISAENLTPLGLKGLYSSSEPLRRILYVPDALISELIESYHGRHGLHSSLRLIVCVSNRIRQTRDELSPEQNQIGLVKSRPATLVRGKCSTVKASAQRRHRLLVPVSLCSTDAS